MSEFESCTVKIHVIEARNLPKMDNIGWCDPYFVVKIGDQTHQTKIVKNTANPKYNEIFNFFIRSPKIRTVEISCYDWDKLSPDEFISSFSIPFEEFEDSPVKKWFSLGDKKGDVYLDISADITLKPQVAPMLTRSFIPWSHPLVVFAIYNYTPTPAEDASKPILDVNDQPLEQGFNDMELMENYAYLLKRTDYPWTEWSSIVPLQYGSSQEEDIYYVGKDGTPEHILALADPKNTRGGFAPTSYFDPTCLSNARGTLLSNPDSFTQAVAALLAPPPPPPSQAPSSSSSSSSSSFAEADGGSVMSGTLVPSRRVQRNYIPASHPLVVFAAHSYEPPAGAPTGEVLTDIKGQPLEKGFTDIPLEAVGGVYLLKQADYPWTDWCTLTRLLYATAGEEESEYSAKGESGPQTHLLYLADPRTASRGGFAPTSYLDPTYVEAAQAELAKNPTAFAETIALLTAPITKKK